MNAPFRSRQFARCIQEIQPVPLVRMPNQAWLDFMTGELTADDWALIGRVERGEITVDEAMAQKNSGEPK
jgi:hypothetical protein